MVSLAQIKESSEVFKENFNFVNKSIEKDIDSFNAEPVLWIICGTTLFLGVLYMLILSDKKSELERMKASYKEEFPKDWEKSFDQELPSFKTFAKNETEKVLASENISKVKEKKTEVENELTIKENEFMKIKKIVEVLPDIVKKLEKIKKDSETLKINFEYLKLKDDV